MEKSPVVLLLGLIIFYQPTILANEIDVFSSARDIEHLFKNEEELQVMMQEQLIATQRQAKILDWFLDTFYGEGYENYTEADAEEYVSNPINTYCLLKRTALHWPRVKAVIFNDTVDKQMEALIDMMNKTSQPASLTGAFSGLFSMQHTYNLDIKELSTGKIRIPQRPEESISDDFALSAKDLQDIGKIAFDRGFYDRAYEFYMTAEWKAYKDGGNQTDEIPSIREMLKVVVSTHDNTLIEKGHRGSGWSTYLIPINEALQKDDKFKNLKEKNYHHSSELFVPLSKTEDLRDQFNMLCRGEKARSPKHDKNLKCFFLHYDNAYLRFYPLKVEEVNINPYVTVFHEFLEEKEIDTFISEMPVNKTIKTMEEIEKESDMPPEFEFDPILDIIKEADEKLNFIKTTPSKKETGKGKKKKSSKPKASKESKPKKVSAKNNQEPGESLPANSNSEATKSRSEDAILDHDTKDDSLESIKDKDGDKQASSGKKKNKTTKRKKSKGKKGKKTKRKSNKISGRINLAMNLIDNDVDDKSLQIDDLGIGGSYYSNTLRDQIKGKDLEHPTASFLVFLTDVEAGGATVFPNLGITLWPKKGNAVFWHRKDENGNLDPVMSYGSCPVLHGMKLGINKNVIVAKGRNQILQHRVTK